MSTKYLSRRKFLKLTGLSIISTLFSTKQNVFAENSKKPNIILIMADDLGYECLGCNGSLSYRTPHLDALAKTGVRFTNCYSQPLCTPSRVKIMTGKYNFRNYTEFGALDPEEKTFGHLMQKAGYRTCVVGKWQLAARNKGVGTYPRQAGFHEYCLWQIDQRGSRYWNPLIVENDKIRRDTQNKYGPDIFCEYILNFIEKYQDKPFFIYYPMVLTHNPFVPTPDTLPSDNIKNKDNIRFFSDMVTYMDKIIGKIVNKLVELDIHKDTLIIFTADNGTHQKIISKTTKGFIKGGKGLPTDAGTHVPLIVNWPGRAASGKVCDDLIDFTDFLPTLAEIARVEIPQNWIIDGRSFAPQIFGKMGNPREWIFCHYDPRWGKWKSTRFVRNKRWKLYWIT